MRLIRNIKFDYYDAMHEKLTFFHKTVFLAISLIARMAETVSKTMDRVDLRVSNWSTHYLYNHSRRNERDSDYRDYDY